MKFLSRRLAPRRLCGSIGSEKRVGCDGSLRTRVTAVSGDRKEVGAGNERCDGSLRTRVAALSRKTEKVGAVNERCDGSLRTRVTTLFRNTEKVGAGNEVRTRDLNLGKVALYQLSYSRVLKKFCTKWPKAQVHSGGVP